MRYVAQNRCQAFGHGRWHHDATLEFGRRTGALHRTEKKKGFVAGALNLKCIRAKFGYPRIYPTFSHEITRVKK